MKRLAVALSAAMICAVVQAGPGAAQEPTAEELYLKGRNMFWSFQTKDQSVPVLEQATEMGSADAPYYLGQYYCEKKDGETAAKWFQVGTDRGNLKAAATLGKMYAAGNCSDSISDTVIETDLVLGELILRSCADRGGDACMLALGQLYARANEKAAARYWIGKSAELGNEDAELSLKFVKIGPGDAQTYDPETSVLDITPKPELTVLAEFREASPAASASSAPAAAPSKDWSGFSVDQGWDFMRAGDEESAYWVFKTHADEGDAAAMVGLGTLYELGSFVGPRPDKAIRWYESAMHTGDANGEALFGWLTYSGQVWASADGKHRRIGMPYLERGVKRGGYMAKDVLAEIQAKNRADNAAFKARIDAIGRPCRTTVVDQNFEDNTRTLKIEC